MMWRVTQNVTDGGENVVITNDFHSEAKTFSEPPATMIFPVEIMTVHQSEIVHEFLWLGCLDKQVAVS